MKKERLLPVLALTALLIAVGLHSFNHSANAKNRSSEGPITITVTPERSHVYHQPGAEVILHVHLKGEDTIIKRKRPLNLAIVLDRSGSMAGPKLEKAKQAARYVIDQLNPEDVVSLVVYDSDVSVLSSATYVKERRQLKSLIDTITSGGSTALYGGVEVGAGQLREHLSKKKVNRALLLSDGIANVGPSSAYDLSRLGTQLRREGISVSTIGLGDDYNEDLMMSLAEASDARYYYVRDVEQLPKIFAQELESLQSIVASNIQIQINCPNGVIPIEVIGQPEIKINGQNIKVEMGHIYKRREISYLIRCKVTDPTLKPQKVANVSVTYENAQTEKNHRASLESKVNFTKDEAASTKSIDIKVGKELALTETRIAKEKALKLQDEGRYKDAAKVLNQRRTANQSLPTEIADMAEVKEEEAILDATAQQMESGRAFDKSQRKGFQERNYKQKKSY